MPSDSSLKAFLSSLSPEDVATLFAGLRNTLPIGMGVYSPELNAGEAEVIAKRQAERDAARAREMEILSRLLPQTMARRQAMAAPGGEPDLFVPTRPRVMKESPFMFTQPQMSRVPRQYAGGGGVFGKKSLDQMQAELLSKEGLSRRALFGLKPDYPLATKQEPLSKVEQEVQRAEQAARKKGEAPSVTASRVDVDPGTGRKKSIMESVTETPVSRRTVLKTAGSQVAQSMLPMGDLMKLAGAPAVTSPVGAIAQAARTVPATSALTEAMMPGLVARGMKQGIEDPNEMVQFVTGKLGSRMKNIYPENIEDAFRALSNPYEQDLSPLMEELTSPAESWVYLTGLGGAYDPSLAVMKQSMRSMKQSNPEVYEIMKNYIRDAAAASAEEAILRGERIPFNVRSSMGRYKVGD